MNIALPAFKDTNELTEFLMRLLVVVESAQLQRNRVIDDIQDSMPGPWVCVPNEDFETLRLALSRLNNFLAGKRQE